VFPRLRQRSTAIFMPLTKSDSSICSVHIVIKEQTSLSLLCDGGLHSLKLKGDMNLQISNPASAHLKITLLQLPADAFRTALQFKQHPNVAKFAPGAGPEVVALKDPGRVFPVGQSLAVLKWRYAGGELALTFVRE